MTALSYRRFTRALGRELRAPDRFTRALYAEIPGRKPALFRSAAVLTLALILGCGVLAGPRASATEAAVGTVRVSTVDELLAAIAPDTTIELAAGTYDLSAAANYGQDTHSSY